MFRYEAGRELPWSDNQILSASDGPGVARNRPMAVLAPVGPVTPGPCRSSKQPWTLAMLLPNHFRSDWRPTPRSQRSARDNNGRNSAHNNGQRRFPPILSPIDKMFGGEAARRQQDDDRSDRLCRGSDPESIGVIGAATRQANYSRADDRLRCARRPVQGRPRCQTLGSSRPDEMTATAA